VPPSSSGVTTTKTRQTFVGSDVGVPVGEMVGGSLGEREGTVVGYGVVGAGVLVVGIFVGDSVGPCVGTQLSKGTKLK